MNAKFEHASTFKQIIDAIKDLVTEANVNVSPGTVSIQALDSSHVALIHLFLYGFNTANETAVFGLSITNLATVLKCAKSDDTLSLAYKKDADVCNIAIRSAERSTDFELKLMTINADAFDVPPLNYPVAVEIDSKEFKAIISDLANISDTCYIDITPTEPTVKFSATGSIGTIAINQKCTVIKCSASIKQFFAIRYLSSFTLATPLNKNVRLYLDPEQPLIVHYGIAESSFIKYFLAPKIDCE